MPPMMRAMAIPQPGGPEALVLAERPIPEPKSDAILIAVAHAGVNRPDVLQRQGHYPPPPGASDLPGLEVAGRVAAIGSAVTRWQVGDAVCALTPGGGYATLCLAPAAHALPVPAGLTLAEAAALPETFATVWHNVFERGGLTAGETLLVHGGASGIGTTAIQLGKAFGAQVIATVGSAPKAAACRALGADVVILHTEEDFVAAVLAATDGRGADVVLDMVGGDYVTRNYRAAAIEGRIVQIAFLRGGKTEADFRLLMTKRLTHTGSTLRPRSDADKARLLAQLEAQVWPHLEAGRIKPLVTARFPLEQAGAAHALMESNALIGKIVLDVEV